MNYHIFFTLILLQFLGIFGQSNLFQNPGFEELTGWECFGCNVSLSTDSHGGNYSYQVSERKQTYSSPSQTLTVPGGHYYYFKAWVKLLHTVNGHLHHDFRTRLDVIKSDGSHEYPVVGRAKFVYPGRWQQIGGDYFVPENAVSVKYYIMIPEKDVDYLIDDARMEQVAPLVDFHNRTDIQIDKIRKADVSISLNGLSGISGLEVEVQQITSDFGWGSAVDAKLIVDQAHQLYQNFFYDMYEWGVLANALKWRQIERKKEEYDYDTPLQAINAIQSRGIKMRGHNIFWGGPHVPNWQMNMTATELKPELEKHLQGMAKHFKGRFQQWDVNNENIHQHFYEDRLKYKYVTHWMFNETKRLDPTADCYLNDYNVVSSSVSTLSYLDQALWFKSSGVPVGGIGIQSHFHAFVDVEIVQRRLDEVAAAGLPIWITELDVNEPDENKKAEKYENLMRLYFSHPSVKGVIIWHYWDGKHHAPQAALANGPNVTPNAAGRKVQELLKHTWRTNEKHNISHGHTVNIRAFQGSYKLLVHHNGKVIHTQNFHVGPGSNSLKVNLSGSETKPVVDTVLIG